MADILERLRRHEENKDFVSWGVCRVAADEIERLRHALYLYAGAYSRLAVTDDDIAWGVAKAKELQEAGLLASHAEDTSDVVSHEN